MRTKIILTPDNSIGTIQKALDTRGALIVFSPGVYHITKPIYANSGQVLYGHGATLRQSGKIHNLLMTRTYNNTIGYNGTSYLTIDGLTIEGVKKYATKLNLLTLWHASNVTIRKCKLLDCCYFHHLEINGSEKVTVENCDFLGYVSDRKNDFREMIQIDFSSAGDIYMFEIGSKCYDLTTCQDIIIRDCRFGPSEHRPGASACIGNHTQPIGGLTHKRILLDNLQMTGYGTNPNAAAIKLIGMNDVTVRKVTTDGFGRLAIIFSNPKSYGKGLTPVKRGTDDGLCKNILFEDCTIKNPTGTIAAHGIYSCSTYGKHKGVVKRQCSIVKE